MEKIKIKYLRNISKVEKIENGDWIDLRCAKDTVITKGDFVLLPLGIAMKLPDGYEALLAPRSSTFKRYGLLQTNSVGVIDNSYSGDNDEWMLPVYATKDTIVNAGDRICQFRVQKKQPDIEFEIVDSLGGSDRGGFGSTGVK